MRVGMLMLYVSVIGLYAQRVVMHNNNRMKTGSKESTDFSIITDQFNVINSVATHSNMYSFIVYFMLIRAVTYKQYKKRKYITR